LDLKLIEYQPRYLRKSEFPQDLGLLLWKEYADQVGVEFPTVKAEHQWILQPYGWVGHIPLSRDFGITIEPKVPLKRLFEMLEVAYRLQSIRFLRGTTGCSSVPEFYDRLASVLASRTLDRGRQGYYREYVGRRRSLRHVTGRLDVGSVARSPWRVSLPCSFEEHTGDIADNQILLWTLSRIRRSSACTEHTLRRVSQAYRELSGVAMETVVCASDCDDRSYNRLNVDYGPLHALCRFFLDQTGPTHVVGERRTVPFLVNMASLFELFVAEWLASNLDEDLDVRPQERVVIDTDANVAFQIDLVIQDRSSQRTICVADTKYKAPSHPSTADIQQIVAYAVSQDCTEAVLIYPCEMEHSLDLCIGNVHVRSLVFDLGRNLDEAGRTLIQGLRLSSEDLFQEVVQ